MPTDDDYSSYLTPPAANGAADDDYSSYLAPPTSVRAGPLSMGQDDTLASKAGKIAGTAGIEGLSDIPGMIGNLGQLNNYAVAGLESAAGHVLPGVFPQYNKPYGDLLSQGEQARQNNPVMQGLARAFPTGQDIANTAANTLDAGLYAPDPHDPIAQTALATARAGLGMIGPGALGEAAKAASTGADVLSGATAARVAASLPTTVAKGAVAGGTGEVVNQQTGNPFLGAMTGAVVPESLAAGAAKLGPALTVLGSPGAQAAADARMFDTATNPVAALRRANTQPELVPSAPATLAEQTQDPGLAAAQKLLINQTDAENKISPVATAVQDIQNRQNAARTDLLSSTAPADADVMAPSVQFQRLKTQAEARAAVGNAITPEASPLEESGAALRDQLAQENQNAGNLVSSLYDTVRASDPKGEFNIFTQPAARAAQSMVKEFDPAVDVESPIAAPVMQKVANLPDVMPLNRLMKMDTTITEAMATANRAGDLGGARQLTILKGHVMDALNDAIDGQNEVDNLAVQKGQMAPANTIGARIDQVEQNVSNRNAASGSLTGTGPNATASTSSFNSGTGVTRENAPGPGISGGGSGVAATPASGNVKPSVFRNSVGKFQAVPQNSVDPATMDMLQAAKAFHAERAQTYRQGAVGSALDTNGFKGQYKSLDADVAAKAFPGGDKGYEQTSDFIHAGANSHETVGILKNIALARLRKADEPITQKDLDNWKSKYAGSLKAIDKHSPGFSSSFDHIVAANENAIAAGTGVAKTFLGFTDPSEAVKTVGTMLRAKDGPTQIKSLLSAVKGDPKSIGGIRAAAIEDMKAHGMSAGGILSYHKISNYLSNNRASLEALFGKDSPEMHNLDDLNASLKVTQDAENMAAQKGTSYTTRGLAGSLQKLGNLVSKHREVSIGTVLGVTAMEQLSRGELEPHSLIALGGLAVAKHFLSSMRTGGLRSVNDLYIKGFEDPEVGKAMIQRVLDKNGAPRPKLVKAALQALSTSLRASQVLSSEQPRQARAAGGRISDVKIEKLVQRLMDLAEKSKKSTAQHTKPLLTVPDNIVAKALEISNRAI